MLSVKKVLACLSLSVALTAATGAVASAAPAASRINVCNAATWCTSGTGTVGSGTVWIDFRIDNGNGLATVGATVCPGGGGLCGQCRSYQEDVPYHGTFDCGVAVRPGDTVNAGVNFNGTGHADITIGWHQ